MTGVIFTLKRKRFRIRLPKLRMPDFERVKSFLQRRGKLMFFLFAMIAGLIFGSLTVNSLSKKTLDYLDFLFALNFPERLKSGLAGAFFAEFSSDFIFIFAAVFFSFSLFGALFLPLLAFFKGFGIGISAAYLISGYGLKGALFYFLIILPGVFLFGMILLYELSAGLSIYKKIFYNIARGRTYPLKGALSAFLKKSVKFLLLTLAVSAGDSLLWFLFAGLFKF